MSNNFEKELKSLDFENDCDTEQYSKKKLEELCKYLNLPFNKQTCIAIIFGDNQLLPERKLPTWINELQ